MLKVQDILSAANIAVEQKVMPAIMIGCAFYI